MQSLKQMHLESLPISQRWLIYEGDEWEVFAYAHKDVKYARMPREWAPRRPITIYKPLKEIEPLALLLGNSRGHRTRCRRPPDAQTRPVLQRKPRVPLLNYAHWSLTVTCGPSDATKWAPNASGTHRSRAQRVLQTHDLTGLMRREGCKPPAHRTHTTGCTLKPPTEDRLHRTHE